MPKKKSKNRLREIVSILLRHDIVRGLNPIKLRLILEDLGPTFIKIGQIMSMRPDILSKEYCEELSCLTSSVTPLDYQEIKGLIEKEFGVGIEDIFSSISEESLGTASMAQVHEAYLKTGERVVVKVQKPDIFETMQRDINLLKKAIKLVNFATDFGNLIDFNAFLDEMWEAAKQEMDFLNEARNLLRLKENNKEINYVFVPKVYSTYTTPRIITMDLLDGIYVSDIEELKKNGYDTEEIALKLAENYAKQIIDDGFFHADPHPGNIIIANNRIGWIDLGMTGHVSFYDRELYKNALKALVADDITELISIILVICTHLGELDYSSFYEDIEHFITKYKQASIASLDMAVLMDEGMKMLKKHKLVIPSTLSMLGRGIVTIQGVISSLSKDLNIVSVVGNHVMGRSFKDFDFKKELLKSGQAIYASTRKMILLPAQASDLMKMALKGQTKINIEFSGNKEPFNRINEMMNRMMVCIIIAALLVGSSLLCLTNMELRFLGIPLIGIAGYFGAVILGILLLLSIYRSTKK